ncbi:hypothetical protein ABFS83_12G010400 [Erythranthe nasuta]
MDTPFSVDLELKIIRARNIDLKSCAELFVRCYLYAGSNKTRVKIDSEKISSKSDLTWNQTFSLNCTGTKETIKSLENGTITFELRRRISAPPLIGRMMAGSKLVARADMRWNDVVAEKGLEIEKWVVMVPEKSGRRVCDDAVKPPAVLIAAEVKEREVKRSSERKCGDCNDYCVGCEYFAIGAALEAF